MSTHTHTKKLINTFFFMFCCWLPAPFVLWAVVDRKQHTCTLYRPLSSTGERQMTVAIGSSAEGGFGCAVATTNGQQWQHTTAVWVQGLEREREWYVCGEQLTRGLLDVVSTPLKCRQIRVSQKCFACRIMYANSCLLRTTRPLPCSPCSWVVLPIKSVCCPPTL